MTLIYDIHNHLIPGVDDGAQDLDESITMIKQYIESGYSGVVTSSHYDKGRYLVTRDKVLEGIEKIKNRLIEENISFELYPGNEIQIDSSSIADIKAGKVLRLNETRYVLCELPMQTKPLYAKQIFYEMQLEGWTPIIAHPERYEYVRKNPDWLLEFIKSGCLVQINLSSIFNPALRDIARKLLDRNMVHIIATDAHQSDWRKPYVKEELDQLKDLIGQDRFDTYLSVNPQKVINDQHINSHFSKVIIKQEEKKPEKKQGLLGKLFGKK